jgi:hypothetical protein
VIAVDAVTSVEALSEDRITRWLADPLGEGDYSAVAAAPTLDGPIWPLNVPRPDGGTRTVHLLDVGLLLYLHRCTRQLSETASSQLLPTVCGYREGAVPGTSYRNEVRRFSELDVALAAEHPYVVIADIQSFFDSVAMEPLLESVVRWSPDETASIEQALHRFREAKVPGLPAGYADVRLLANTLLHQVDSALHLPFVRYVDDYRLYADTLTDAGYGIDALRVALEKIGLTLNESKSSILSSEEYLASKGRQLTSVFHPETETVADTQSALREVFIDATARTVISRRDLRYCLPRMADVGDDFAVGFCIHALAGMPWEAPRITAYLAQFVQRPEVEHWLAHATADAASRNDHWMLGRLAPLLCNVPLTEAVAEGLIRYLSEGDATAAWGITLRALSRAGRHEALDLATGPAIDARAAIGACADLGAPLSAALRARAPITASMSAHGFPLPRTDSLL